MKWKLDNVEARAKENPGTFHIPEIHERKGLEPGMFAKLIFLQGDSGERMWVEIKRRFAPGRYEGVLANSPVVIEGLEFGDVLKFEAKNIADISEPSQASGNPNFTMNGMFDAFEIFRPSTPAPEVTINEDDMWYFAAPEEVKKRSRGSFMRPPEGRPFGRPGVVREDPKDWRPTRPSSFGRRPPSSYETPRGEEERRDEVY